MTDPRPGDSRALSPVQEARRARMGTAEEPMGYVGALQRALPEVALMCLTGGTLMAVMLAVGAPLELILLAGVACATIIVPFLALVQRGRRRSARPPRGRRRDTARFSRSRYAYW